jgi:hypothetical protein
VGTLTVLIIAALTSPRWNFKPRPAPAVEQARPVAHLGAWGVTEEGRRWGIVALPRTWHKGDTILLLTDNAKMERKP